MFKQRLIFVTGKGGTGKTTFSLQLAHFFARQGEKTLLVELGNKGSAAYLLSEQRTVSYPPQRLEWGFDHTLLNGPGCLEEYVGSFIRIEKMTRYFFSNPLMQRLLSLAPGLEDLAVLGKLTSHFRGHGPSFNYDRIIVDSPSTGSFLSMLQAPEYLANVVSSGPLRTQSQGITKALKNKDWVHTIFMGLFEELPVDELLESAESFQSVYGPQYSIVMNKYLTHKEDSQDGSWRDFISAKILKQQELIKRLPQSSIEVFKNPLMTNPLRESMINDQKEGDRACFSKL